MEFLRRSPLIKNFILPATIFRAAKNVTKAFRALYEIRNSSEGFYRVQ